MKISTLINDALSAIGVISGTDEPSPQDHSLALRSLNRIVSLYNTQNLITTFMQDIQFNEPSTGWTSPIRIGAGLQFPAVAPTFIQSGFFRQGETDYLITKMTVDQWSQIPFKTAKGIPTKFYEQKISENRTKIYFDQLPMDGLELHFICKLPMNAGVEFVATDDITFGYGVEQMLVKKLAIDLSPNFEVTTAVLQVLAAQLLDAESNVKAFNYEPSTLRTSKTLSRRSRVKNRARY